MSFLFAAALESQVSCISDAVFEETEEEAGSTMTRRDVMGGATSLGESSVPAWLAMVGHVIAPVQVKPSLMIWVNKPR